MKKNYALVILCISVLIISSASVYALSQIQEVKTKENGTPVPYLQDGNFNAEIGIEKNEEPLYNLNGIWKWNKKIITCEGTVISGEQEGTFTGTFKGDKKSYFEIIITIDEEKIIFNGNYKLDKNKEDFQGVWCNGGKEKCFNFIYPISYFMPDGTIITGNSEKEISQLIKEWYKAHPGEKKKPVLQYPVDIKYEDGTIKTINNDEEMKSAYENCDYDKEWGWIKGTFNGLEKDRGRNISNIIDRFPIIKKFLRIPIFKNIFAKILINL